jgi:hypothetical protein
MSTLKNYTNDIQVEATAYNVMKNFEEVIGRKLSKDEQEFTLSVTKKTFEKYIIVDRGDILVVGDDQKEKLDSLLEDMVLNLSTLIVNYIYSRLEAYILYKNLKEKET